MSESSKMGLFGSKDDKKESTSDDAPKPDSSDRYSPYCIDSDSETYDTEALSIMDINDIIGVQTGQAVESTLESEIAALTEIITDSKGETNCDTMNEIHGESSDAKFSEELLTEFSSFSPSENPIPTTSRVGFQERLITHVVGTGNGDKNTSNKSILEEITSIEDETQDRLIKGVTEVETDVKLSDKVANEASEDVPFGEVERNNELDVIKAEDNIEAEPLFSAARSSGDTIQKHEVLASEGAEFPITTDTTSETETIMNTLPETGTDSLEQTLEAVEMGAVEERKDDDKDPSKCEDVSMVSVEDAAEDSPNAVKEIGHIADTRSEEKEAVDDPEDEKSTDVLTNLGSTSKSLQLIGEAYISEDSQETDERDESPDVKVVFVPLAGIVEKETEEKNEKQQQNGSSDHVPTDTLNNEFAINVMADITESTVGKFNSDNQDSMSLEDNDKPDKTKELSPNLEDNQYNHSQDINTDLKIHVYSKDNRVIEKAESVDPSLQNDEIKDKSNESVEVRLPSTVCIDRGTSATSESISITEIIGTKEECLQEIKLPEDIPSKSEAQTREMITADEVSEIQISQSLEVVRETTSDRPKLSDEEMQVSETDVETLNLNREIVSETNNFSEQNEEPSQKTKVLPSVVSSCSVTESNNITETIPEIQIQNAKPIESVESLAANDEQDHVTSVKSINKKELVDSQSNEDSESAILLGKVDTNIKDEVDECVGAAKSAIKITSIQEKSKEISDNVEQLLETVKENTEECIMDNINIEKETIDDGKTEQTDKDICIDKLVQSIEKEDEKMESESNELQIYEQSQSPSMKITSPIVEETVIDSGENKDHLGIGKIGEEIDEAENLGTELDQLANMSETDNVVPIEDVIGTTKQDTTELSKTSDVEKLSNDIVRADSASSKIPEENLNAEKDNSTVIETNELSEAKLSESKIKMEEHIKSQSDAIESEVLTSNTKDVPKLTIETTLENTTSGNVKLNSLGIVEPDLNEDDINKVEMIEELREFQEICEADRVDSEQRNESQISEADEKKISETQVCDKNQQLEKDESISELSGSVREKPMDDTSDKDQEELEKNENVTESSTEMVSDIKQTVAEFETALEIGTTKNPLKEDSDSEPKPQQGKIEEEPKIEAIQHQTDGSEVSEHSEEIDNESKSTRKNDETPCRELSPLNAKCGSPGLTLDPQSEILTSMIVDEEQESCEIQPEEPEDKTDSQTGPDDTLQSVFCEELMEDVCKTAGENLPEDQAGENLDTQIESEELREVESISSTLSNVSKLLENEEELEKDKQSLVKPVGDDNLDDVANIHSSQDTVELKQILSDKNEVEISSEATEINLTDEIVPITLQSDDLIEMEVKIDEDLQCKPIEELAKLAVVADEILIDEIANSVLKDTVQPLENISTLGILPHSHLSISTIISSDEMKGTAITNESSEIEDQPVSLLEVETCFIEDLNQTPSVSHGADYITDVIISSTKIDNIELADNIEDIDENVTADEFEDKNQGEAVKTSENLIPKDTVSIDPSIASISEKCKLEVGGNLLLDKSIDLELPLKLEEEKLIESAVLQACDAKIDLSDEVLFDTENADQADVLCNTLTDNVDTSQQSSEFSELECAVKFLQESEEQTIDSPLLLSPKIAEEIVEDNSDQSKSCLFLSETEVCQDTLELPVELEEITPDSIAISEAEIISEAAKLENERKLKIAEDIIKTSVSVEKLDESRKSASDNNSEMLKSLLTTPSVSGWQEKLEENIPSTSEKSTNIEIPKLSDNIIIRSEKIPKISILEERLKEPPKIEIPVSEISPKISDTPTTPKTSLLMQRDSRTDTKSMYQKMLESPKGSDKIEPKIADTPRKDSDKYDFENVGSPRIILKIAKSAIADCAEPRSPKSPKIRSATNSPNPEDSPGQKLGKIKLKLSKGGHPSIISNENFDESAQRHTEAILSPSHIGMKIKLSKTGDASIIQPEKYDSIDDIKETKHRFEESSPKRIESPLGMKIKLSKTGDPSIIQQESKESTSKRKDKLDIGQEIPKRTDSPIGMKIKLSKSGDASIIQPEKQEISDDAAYMEIPKRTESPIGMKIKLSKTGDASIISSECSEEFKDLPSRSRDKLSTNQDTPKRTDSPLGMKFKLSKSGGASIIQPEKAEGFEDFKDKSDLSADVTKRVESPIGMKIKLSKSGDASIIHPEKQESDEHKDSNIIKHREKSETQDIQKRTDSPLGMRIKVTKTGEASVVPSEEFKECLMLNTESFEITREVSKRTESPIGMKIKLSKSGDASIIHPEKQDFFDETKDSSTSNKGSSIIPQEGFKSLESSLGMKIKLSKTGDASIIHPDIPPDCKDPQLKRTEKLHSPGDGTKRTDSPLGMKIKLSKTGDASIIEPDKKEKTTMKQKEKLTIIPEVSQKRKEMEYPLEMKIKLSKTGHPTIIANEKQESFAEMHSKIKDYSESGQSTHHKYTESMSPGKDSQLRIFKTGHSTIIQSSRSEVTIEPVQMHQERPENSLDISSACNKEVIISPVDHKKSKLEAKLSHILPEVTIQPVTSGEQQQIMLDKKSSTISRQQMSVINQEISITHVSHSKPADLSMSGKLKEILRKNATNSPASSDCEIIEHRPELIIVNENSNSSQDIMIIEEVKPPPQEVKVPRKRGRPKRSSLPPGQTLIRPIVSQDPLALDNVQQSAAGEHRESDRPKRTCRSQKSYAPPKRGRGRGRGKRKMDRVDCAIGKIPRLEDPLTAIERSTMSLIAPLQPRLLPEATAQTSELYKALKQSPEERKRLISENLAKQGFPEVHKKMRLEPEPGIQSTSKLSSVSIEEHLIPKSNVDTSDSKAVSISEILQLTEPVTAQQSTEKFLEAPKPDVQEPKNIITDMTTTEHQNWLTPSIKLPEPTGKMEPISMVQVMDEETRMSAESNSRSQTPARNISIPAVETVINEESQGSVLSTATTESEKVKVRNRRMEINFDPDEGPFTVDKIAEYEWPLDKKGDTFMIQEQISQYLGVKSFKRKYPDLKRRMVEMEERNFLRENCLVSEAMCDMGLTAICSSEVLDIMCSDFPDQYEEYRKHMREKQAKEHSKKQKELTAAANAERNRIDLAEMAVQSALSWNVNFNRARKESRKYSLDLQSFTIHQPKKQLKVDPERKASNYPVALIPGQYTDYYREYTPAELRYYPLNTVLYGPMRPNERKFDSQSEGSQSDSDSDSSSDDSSSSSSEGTQDTEESQSTVDEVEMEISSHKEDNKNLKCKMCLKHLNKHGKAEVLIQCGTCNGNVHPSCIDLTLDMVPHIQGYSWQCTDCKTCVQCHNPADEDKMLFCDMCDRGYHIYCVGLRRVPQGRWHCRECAVCASCGLRQPGGANSDRNSVAQWQHEYKKGERNTRVYVSTLCVPCSKLWRKGRYCPHCSRCHSAQRLDLEPNLVHCGACDKYLHLGCVEIRSGTLDRKNYICDWCSTPGQQISRSLISKNFRT